MEPGEPEWLQEDAQAVLDLMLEEQMLCPGCGLPRDETMDKEADGRYRARAQRCHACAARENKARQYTPRESGGLFIGVERVG